MDKKVIKNSLDFKNVTFGKIHSVPSEVNEVKRSCLRPNFVSELVFESYNSTLPLDFGFNAI